jgi:hypothetical protein
MGVKLGLSRRNIDGRFLRILCKGIFGPKGHKMALDRQKYLGRSFIICSLPQILLGN